MSPNTFLKSVAFTLILWFSIATVSAQVTQKIGGNPYAIDAKAVLELESTTKGFLLPRMTASQMADITTPTEGMMVYCTDCGVGTDGELRIAYNSVWQTFKGNLTGNVTGDLTGNLTSTSVLADGVTATTQATGDSSTKLATTEFVTAAASSSNFVDLTTAQTIGGIKTFNSDAIVNGLTVGRGNGIVGTSASNTAVGSQALLINTTAGSGNTAIGQYTLRANISGDNNTAIGSNALIANSSGQQNTALGIKSLFSNTIGSFNTASGVHSLYSNTEGQQNAAFGYAALETITAGSDNAVLGAYAGRYIFDGETSNTIMNKSVLIGAETKPLADNGVNEIVIGFQAIGNGSNTVQLGNPEIINVKTSGTITADAVTYPKAHGTSGQVLSTTGSGTLTWTNSVNGTSIPSSKTLVVTTDKLSALSATTSAELAGVISDETGTGSVVLAVSPALTGVPTAPTAAAATNTTQLATTAFVTAAASSSNFVDLTTAQSVAGVKTFSSGINVPTLTSTGDISISGITIGTKGIANNTLMGTGALQNGASGGANTAIGSMAINLSTGSKNTAIGTDAMRGASSGDENTAVGYDALGAGSTGVRNTGVGVHALRAATGTGVDNASLGHSSGKLLTTGAQNTFIGVNADVFAAANSGVTNSTAIGYNAKVTADNTIRLGNDLIDNVKTSGTLTADAVTYPKAHGTSGQVLSTTGSGALTWSTPSTTATAYSGILPVANGGTGSSTQNFVDLTTEQNVGGLKTFTSNDGLVATGTYGSGTASSLGAGTRMMWYPKKAAFRAGSVDGTQWDDANIGVFSTALGNNTIASGNISIATGNLTTASGNTSTAMGYRTTASGEIATALGDNNTASGNISIAMGYATKAKSYAETVIGTYNTDYTPSSISLFVPTDRLFVIGNGTLATPSNALVMLKNGNTTFSGQVTTGVDAIINGVTIGKGGSNLAYNTAIGKSALAGNVTGGQYNTAIGESSLLINSTGSYNTAFGFGSGSTLTTGSENTLIGVNSATSADGTNAIAIGFGATASSNTVRLGNSSITNVITAGTLTAGNVTYSNTKGTNGQVLITDAAGVTSWGSPAASVIEVADEFTATASQTSFTLTQTPSANSKVKMFINGIRISKTAYNWTGTTLTYNPANNGSYALVVGDRIQFDYYTETFVSPSMM